MDMIQKLLNLNDSETNFSEEYFCQQKISSLSRQGSEKPETWDTESVSLWWRLNLWLAKNRDISPKCLFYQAQNLMCRRNKYTFLSWRNYLFWKNYAQTETQVLIWYCNSWDLLFNTSASPLHRKQAGQSLFQLLCCSFTSKPCRAPLHEMQWSKLWSPLEMV